MLFRSSVSNNILTLDLYAIYPKIIIIYKNCVENVKFSDTKKWLRLAWCSWCKADPKYSVTLVFCVKIKISADDNAPIAAKEIHHIARPVLFSEG